MKHLKPYNETYITPNMKSEIEDICLELNDDGFTTTLVNHKSVSFNSSGNKIFKKDVSCLDIGKRGYRINPFYYKEIEDVIERIKDYANSEGYQTDIHVRSYSDSSSWIYNDEFQSPLQDKEIAYVNIFFHSSFSIL